MPYAYAHRFVDYSVTPAPNIHRAVLRFVYGIRKHRVSSVTLKQIEKYFRATPVEFIRKSVDHLVEKGCLLMLRSSPNRKRTSYVYCETNQGVCYLYQGIYYDTEDGRKIYCSRDE